MTGITLAIPTYNRARLLRQTLESLSRVSVPGGLQVELVIINNNCTDNTPAVVSEMAPRLPFPVRVVFEPKPGLNQGRNRALREAAFEHVVYFDDDVNVVPEWLDGYREAVERLEAECVVGPVRPSYEQKPPAYMTPVILESLVSAYSVRGDTLKQLPGDVAHEVPGCNFGVSKAVAVEVGGFSTGLDRMGSGLLAGGDSEFGARLVKAGKRIVYQPRCAIEHVISREKMERSYLRLRWQGIGATQRLLTPPNELHESPGRRARQVFGIARRFAAAAALQLVNQPALSFEQELEGRKALGYLRRAGRPGTSSNPVIELVGGGSGNKGDELMMQAVLAALRPALPSAQFASTVWTGTYEERARWGLYQKMDNRAAGRLGFLIDLLMHRGYRSRYGLVTEEEIKAIVDLSGFAYGDTWGPDDAKLMAVDSLRWKKSGKKLILLPQAFGPFTSEPIRQAFREVILNANLVFARDRISLENVRELCGPLNHIKMAPDITTDMQGVVPPGYPTEPKRSLVVPNVQMVRRTPPQVRERYVPFMVSVIRELDRRDLRPALLLHTKSHDDELAREIVDSWGRPIDVIRDDDPLHLKGIIGQALLVVGSRYHSAVSALSQGVPTLGTAWAHKYTALVEEYDCMECLLDPSAPDEEMLQKLDAVLREPDRSNLIRRIQTAGEKQRQRLAEMWKEVVTLLHD